MRTMETSQKAKRRTAGFSFTEMLVATLLVVLLTGIVASGMRVGSSLYRTSQFQSQSELLAGTIDNSLSAPLRFISQDASHNYLLTYRDDTENTLVNAKLVSRDGQLYFIDNNGAVPLTMAKMYGDCVIGANEGSVPSSDVEISDLVPQDGIVRVSFWVTDKKQPSHSRHFSYSYRVSDSTKTHV